MSEKIEETVTPQQRFDAAFGVAEEARQKVLALLDGLSQDEAGRRPATDEWSIGEIAEHLIRVEQSYCGRILDIVSNAQESDVDQGEVLANRPFALEDVADVAKVGKAKAPPSVQPSGDLSIEELRRQLVQAREETRSKLTPFSRRDLTKLYYEHPRLGPMSVYEQIKFIGFHELKHLAQMERRLSTGGPSPN